MKFAESNRIIESSVPISGKKIGLSANKKAFQLLLFSIYPDIIKAVVREIISNGWDSQKTAGRETKELHIKYPTFLEPEFSVRDYGNSMTHEQVMEIYSNIFESTKDDSNEEVGMFGIGSKTPLGYTDSFSLQCWQNNVTRIYTIYMDADDCPSISLFYEGESDEPDGTKVNLAVKNDDFSLFQKYIEEFLGNNFPSPVRLNGKLYEVKQKQIKYSGSDWVLYLQNKILYEKSKTMIRMGCVSYPLRTEYMNSLNYNYTTLINNNTFLIDFDIGDFQVAGSREDIIYDKNTVEKISKKIESILKELSIIFQEDIKKCKTFHEAYAKYVSLQRYSNYSLFNSISKNLTYKGKMIETISRKYFNFKINSFDDHDIILSLTKRKLLPKPLDKEYLKILIYDSYDGIITVNEETKRINNRWNTFTESHQGKYLIIKYSKDKPISSFKLRKLSVFLGNIPIKKLEDYEPQKVAKNTTNVSPVEYSSIKKYDETTEFLYYRYVYDKKLTPGYYIESYYGDFPLKENSIEKYNINEIKSLITMYENLMKIKIKEFITIPKTYVNGVKKNHPGVWVNLFDEFKENFDRMNDFSIQDKNLIEKIAEFEYLKSEQNESKLVFHKLKIPLDEIIKVEKQYKNMLISLNIFPKQKKLFENHISYLDKIYKKLIEKYPILKYIENFYGFTTPLNKDFINVFDNLTKEFKIND